MPYRASTQRLRLTFICRPKEEQVAINEVALAEQYSPDEEDTRKPRSQLVLSYSHIYFLPLNISRTVL